MIELSNSWICVCWSKELIGGKSMIVKRMISSDNNKHSSGYLTFIVAEEGEIRPSEEVNKHRTYYQRIRT